MIYKDSAYEKLKAHLGKYFGCFTVVGYDPDGDLHHITQARTHLEQDALVAGIHRISRGIEGEGEPVFDTDEDD